MYQDYLVHAFCICFILAQCILIVSSKKEEAFQFDVKPGGDTHTFTEKLGSISCSFTYSCQGGTNENWVMVMKRDDSFSCEVVRPDKESYLMFSNFDLNVKGAKLVDAMVFKNRNLEAVGNDEFVKDFKANSVKQSNSFKNQLHRVIASASVGKEDL